MFLAIAQVEKKRNIELYLVRCLKQVRLSAGGRISRSLSLCVLNVVVPKRVLNVFVGVVYLTHFSLVVSSCVASPSLSFIPPALGALVPSRRLGDVMTEIAGVVSNRASC